MQQYIIDITPTASKQIRNIIAYYNALQRGLGLRFRSDLRSNLKSVGRQPFSHAIRYRDIRFAVLNKFPYAAHYSIAGNTVIVHAVISMYQDPKTSWLLER